jgi:ABC-type multidrug transport system fused ATPase/permease subunit
MTKFVICGAAFFAALVLSGCGMGGNLGPASLEDQQARAQAATTTPRLQAGAVAIRPRAAAAGRGSSAISSRCWRPARIPVAIINRSYMRRSLMLNEGLNNVLEHEVQVIEAAQEGAVTRHFAEVRAWRVKLSDADALNWTAIEGLSILVFLLVLLRVTYMPNADVGTIFAIFVYVWRLMEKLDMMPQIVQQLMRLKDIRRRIEAVGEQIQRTATDMSGPP